MSTTALTTYDWDALPALPGHWPLLGHSLSMFWRLPDVFDHLRSDPSPLFRFQGPGTGHAILWNSMDALALFRSRASSSQHLDDVAGVIVGRSMISAEGGEHRHMRRAANRPFSPVGLSRSGVTDLISEIVEAHAERLADAESFLLLEETRAVAMEVIFRIMGVPPGELGEWAKAFRRLIVGGLIPGRLPLMPHWWSQRARRWLDARLLGFITEARANPAATGLLADLVRAQDDDGLALTDEELLNNLLLLVFAGHETTASTMTWAVAHTFADAAHRDALASEVSRTGGLPSSASAMKAFPVAEGAFREALRLHPPVPIPSRLLVEPMRIAGLNVPAGTIVVVSVRNLSRDPQRFPAPHTFDPLRWVGRKLDVLEKIPFGAGRHFCLGYHLAMVEGVQFLVALSRALQARGRTLEMTDGVPRETHVGLTWPKKRDTRCRVIPA